MATLELARAQITPNGETLNLMIVGGSSGHLASLWLTLLPGMISSPPQDSEPARAEPRRCSRRPLIPGQGLGLLAALDQPSLPGPNVIARKRVVEFGRLEAVELAG
jgi:hypothetical protein